GPFIAIGRPSEWLSNPGPDPTYTRDNEWQGGILHWLGRCQAVVLQPRPSEGVRWGGGQVLGESFPLPQGLLSLINCQDRPNDYEALGAWLERDFGVRLPLAVPFVCQRCFAYFEPDRTVRLQPVCHRSPLLWTFTGTAVDVSRTFRTF